MELCTAAPPMVPYTARIARIHLPLELCMAAPPTVPCTARIKETVLLMEPCMAAPPTVLYMVDLLSQVKTPPT